MTTFQVGNTYRHTTGKRLTIIGVVATEGYGTAFIGEDETGEFIPVGADPDNAVNWTLVHESEQEASELW